MAKAPAVGLHWWTFTTGSSVEDVLDRIGGAHSRVEPVGGYGHPRSICHESGARVYFGSPRQEQPVCVNAPGEVCEGWAGELVTWAEDLAGVVTRNDLAVDLEPAEDARKRMVELRQAWKRRQVETAIRTFEEHRNDEGWTWYFGGKSANLRLRVYDRRGPLRLEFQWRPDREIGRQIPEMIARRGTATVWRSLAKGIQFPRVSWYQELVNGEAVELAPAVRDESLLAKVIEQMQLQFGTSLWAFQQLGIGIEELATPPENIRGDTAAKFLRWADDAKDLGYDGGKLRAEVKCRLKSRRSTD